MYPGEQSAGLLHPARGEAQGSQVPFEGAELQFSAELREGVGGGRQSWSYPHEPSLSTNPRPTLALPLPRPTGAACCVGRIRRTCRSSIGL